MAKQVFAYNTSFGTIQLFASEAVAMEAAPGLSIAEGEWVFFSADGSSLEAAFSTPARFDPELNKFFNGVYTFRRGNGPTLTEFLRNLCTERGALHLWTFEQMESYFKE